MKTHSKLKQLWSIGVLVTGGTVVGPVGATAQIGPAENFLTPSFRGESDTTFDGWSHFLGGEAYTPAGGPGGNTPNWSGSDDGAFLRQTDSAAGAFITSGGGFYSIGGILQFEVEQTTSFDVGMVVFQVRTSGQLPDYDSVLLRYEGEHGPVYLSPYAAPSGQSRIDLLDREETFMGEASYTRESLWQWDLSGISGVTNYTILWAASGPHMSFQAATLDAASVFAPIPEPATVTFVLGLAAGAAVLGLRRRGPRREEKEAHP